MTGAGIVTYQPDLKKLKSNIESIYKQVDRVVIIDNGSKNINDIYNLQSTFSNVEIRPLKKNEGVAAALNHILDWANKLEMKWVLTLDQDSQCLPGVINDYEKLSHIPNVAMISSRRKDVNFGFEKADLFEQEYIEVERCITSCCYTNVNAALKVGGFDESMFIDYVDFDMCYSLKEHGYKIIKSHFIGFMHELGESQKKYFFKREVVVTNHSPLRRYYYGRNIIYFIRKHKKSINKFRYYVRAYGRLAVVLVYEVNKKEKLKEGIRGMIDGYKMPLNKEE